MVKRPLAPVAALALLVVAACSAVRQDRGPLLPADRDAPLVYVALGDSTVEGIGASRLEFNWVSRLYARLCGVYPRARLVNLGVAGATSDDVVRSQLARAMTLAPALVTLAVGPNDVTEGVPVERYAANLDTIFGRLRHDAPHAVIVVTLLPDLAVTPRFRGTPAERTVGAASVHFNDALRHAARRNGVDVVDLYGPSRAEVPAHPELVAADGYHPSDAGYARWAELVWRDVQERVPRRS